MSDRLPLTEVSGEEVLARTVYQIILLDYARNQEQYENPATRLFDLALQWSNLGLKLIADELQLVAIWCAQGSTVRQWLSTRTLITTGRATRLAHTGRSRRR
jgi:hypothetical protein